MCQSPSDDNEPDQNPFAPNLSPNQVVFKGKCNMNTTRMPKYWVGILMALLLGGAIGCNDIPTSSSAIPTLIPTAIVPTATPLSTATIAPTSTMPPLSFNPHTSIEQLIHQVMSSRVGDHRLDVINLADLGGPEYPDGRISYSADIYITNPTNHSRTEMLHLIYEIMHEYHYNYVNEDLLSLHIIIRNDEDMCTFSMGLGSEAAKKYLPLTPPNDLESWFRAIEVTEYYGYSSSSPNQKDENMAFAGDYGTATTCKIEGWKQTTSELTPINSEGLEEFTNEIDGMTNSTLSETPTAGEIGEITFPIVDDAFEVASSPGVLSYATNLTVDAILSFYEAEMTIDGWARDESSSFVSDSSALVIFLRDSEMVSLIVSEDAMPGNTMVLLIREIQ